LHINTTEAWGTCISGAIAALRTFGRYVQGHPERIEELDKLGFRLSLSKRILNDKGIPKDAKPGEYDPQDVKFEIFLQALKEYFKIMGNVEIPPAYMIPMSDETFSPKVRGVPLGACLYELKSNGAYISIEGITQQLLKKYNSYPNISQEDQDNIEEEAQKMVNYRLSALSEFSFGTGKTVKNLAIYKYKNPFDLIVDCLKVYKELNKNLNVGRKFVVPCEDPWPKGGYNLSLGIHVYAIRDKHAFVEGRPDRVVLLNYLGFRWVREKKKKKNNIQNQPCGDRYII
jgi:hypothetical protein